MRKSDLRKLVSSSTGIVPASKLKRGDTLSFKPFTPGASLGHGTKLADDFRIDPVVVGSSFPVTMGGVEYKGIVTAVTDDGEMLIELAGK